MNFCITGLPRSRTKWFSEYFTACGYKCLHEAINGCGTIEEYENKVKNVYGNSDSGIPFYPFKGKTVIIERDKVEVEQSLSRYFDNVNVDNLVNMLKPLTGLRIKFEDINERLREIHEYCVGDTFNKEIANRYKDMNIQVDMKKYKVSEKTMNLLGEL